MFSSDVQAMLTAGTSLIVGVVGPDGDPRATRALALTVVDADARRVRVVISADDPDLEDYLRSGKVAVTGADVPTLRSLQMKGRIMLVEETRPEDEPVVALHTEAFFRAVNATDGHPTELVRRMLPLRTMAIELIVDEVFDQTPGPDAGRRVAVTA